jgi:hypothetical protein
MIRRSFLFLFSCLVLQITLSNVTWAADQKIVKLVTFNYPPLFHLSKDRRFSGTVGETVKYMCEKANLTCEIEVLPFKRAYQKLDNKLVDGIITIKVDRFKECCIHTDWETPWTAGFYAHKPINEIPQTPTDILGQSLIVVAGMRSPYAFMPNLDQWREEKKIKVFKSANTQLATRMFLSERAPFLWGSEDFNWYFNKMAPGKEFSFLPLVARPVVVWFQKDRPDLKDAFDQLLPEMEANEIFSSKKLLNDQLMDQRYLDAPFYSLD